MYDRILVPLDGSKLAEQVLPYVKLIGKRLDAQIELFQAVASPPLDLADPQHGVYIDTIAAGLLNRAETELQTAAEPLRQDGLTVTCRATMDNPAEGIVAEAEKDPSTLIAMSTHGRSGLARWVLGSVTDKVLHAATNPLLIVRSREKEIYTPDVELREVIVPLDGSDLAEKVLPHVAAIAKSLDLAVTLVRVTPPVGSFYGHMDLITSSQQATLNTEADIRARAYLNEIEGRVREGGVGEVKNLYIHGNPPEVIVDLARGTAHSLVAMTTHGRSGVGRWLLGSVTDRVVRHSGDPVLVIRATSGIPEEVEAVGSRGLGVGD